MPQLDPPKAPVHGMTFWLQTGTHWAIGTNHTVRRVNSRSFYVASQGRVTRRLLCEWDQWLTERFAEGTLHLNFEPITPFPSLSPAQGGPMPDVTLDLHARDQRFLRAATDVLKHYTITRTDPGDDTADDTVTFRVTRGGQDDLPAASSRGEKGVANPSYTVTIEGDWSALPHCDCPDAQRTRETTAGFCKHVIATLLSNDTLRHQLLDVIL